MLSFPFMCNAQVRELYGQNIDQPVSRVGAEVGVRI